mgnify:FL=1|tara:strand:- start:11655 stop:14948 length:3294 start_codon:yes stop_codon:yes gene_type:complete
MKYEQIKTLTGGLVLLLTAIVNPTIYADSSVQVKQEAQEYCLQLEGTGTSISDSFEDFSTAHYVCPDDVVGNSIYSLLGEDYTPDLLMRNGFEPPDEAKIKSQSNSDFISIIVTAVKYITNVMLFFVTLIAFKVAFMNVFGKEKTASMSYQTMFYLSYGIGSFTLPSIVFGCAVLGLFGANYLSNQFLHFYDNSSFNQLISDDDITTYAMNNANELMATVLEADRTERVNKMNFQLINSDTNDKGLTSLLNHDVTKQGARDRVVTETPYEFALQTANTWYFFDGDWNLDINRVTHVDAIGLVKKDTEKRYDYNSDWYGNQSVSGVLYVNNNAKELENRFLGKHADSEEGNIQEISETVKQEYAIALDRSALITGLRTSLRKVAKEAVQSGSEKILSVSDIPDKVIKVIADEMKPFVQVAVTRAGFKTEEDIKTYALMIAGQLVTMAEGGSFGAFKKNGTWGERVYLEPRLSKLQKVFGTPFVENIDNYICSGKRQYREYVAQYKSQVEQYNFMPESMDNTDVLQATNFINTQCVNVETEGLSLIGSMSEADREESLKQANIERLTLALFFSAYKKAGLKVAEEVSNQKTDLTTRVRKIGFTGLFLYFKDLMTMNKGAEFGRQYILDTVSIKANADYSVDSFFLNEQNLFTNRADVEFRKRQINKFFTKINLSEMFRSGTVLQPSVSVPLNTQPTSTDAFGVSASEVLEKLLPIDMKSLKLMWCLDLEKPINDGIREKLEDPDYSCTNYKSVNIFTATQILGSDLIDTSIELKITQAVANGMANSLDFSKSSTGSLSKGGKLSSRFPLAMLTKGVLNFVAVTLNSLSTVISLLFIAGATLKFLIPVVIAMTIITSFINWIYMMVETMFSFPIEAIKQQASHNWKSVFDIFPEFVNKCLAIIIYWPLHVIGLVAAISLLNSFLPDFILFAVKDIIVSEANGPITTFLYLILAFTVIVLVIWLTITSIVKELIPNLVDAVLQTLNTRVNLADDQIGTAMQQTVIANVGNTGLNTMADGVQKGTGITAKRLQALRSRGAERTSARANNQVTTNPQQSDSQPTTNTQPQTGKKFEIPLDEEARKPIKPKSKPKPERPDNKGK